MIQALADMTTKSQCLNFDFDAANLLQPLNPTQCQIVSLPSFIMLHNNEQLSRNPMWNHCKGQDNASRQLFFCAVPWQRVPASAAGWLNLITNVSLPSWLNMAVHHIGLQFHCVGANEGHGRTASSPSPQRCCWWREALQAKAHQKEPITAPCIASTSQDSEVLWRDNDNVNHQPLSVSDSFLPFSLSLLITIPPYHSLSLSHALLSCKQHILKSTETQLTHPKKCTYIIYQIKGPKE